MPTTPTVWSSGMRLTPDRLNEVTWTSFTPSWTATTTNPAIGNGTLSGQYRYVDSESVEVFIIIRPGSTTTFGSGSYRVSLPVDAVSGGPDPVLYGTLLIGSSLYPMIGWANTSSSAASLVSLYRSNTTTEAVASWTPTAPGTFASGNTFSLTGVYRVSW